MFKDKDEVKETMDQLRDSLKGSRPSVSPDDVVAILEYIEDNRERFRDQIPFSVIAEELEMDFETINECLLHLIMKREIIGFINDLETEDKSDDILILRDQHLIDKLNQYEIQ
ncbi:MAG: hypothetical protein D6732_16625 [Methanobacteriota archaeon]|nr:MAG: hypothetical protein D6732_16625 [Euryarchaeota archaeon]